MINEKDLALMDRIMNGVTQARGEWDKIQMSDPMISDAVSRWEAAMEQARDLLPDELYGELLDLHTEGLAVTGDVGILYGIHVADAIRDVAARPTDLSQYVLKRMDAKRKLMESR